MTQAAAAPDYRALLSLDDRGFIVLGAGDGIGAQISHGLAQCGARVFCVDIVEDQARAIAEAVGGTHCAAHVTLAAGVATVLTAAPRAARKSVVEGKRVAVRFDMGCRRLINK